MIACYQHVIYAERMTMIQVRNVPDELHRRLKARAAMEGVSLSELALTELRRSLEHPTRRELLQLIASREPVTEGLSSVELVHEARAGR